MQRENIIDKKKKGLISLPQLKESMFQATPLISSGYFPLS